MEPQNPQMSHDEAKTSLGIATNLQHVLTGADHPKGPQKPETTPEQQEMAQPQEDLSPRIDDLEMQFKDFQKEVNQTIKEGIGQVTDLVKEVIMEDDNNGKQE